MINTNTADLHLQYRMETGEWFQWDNSKYNINAFHGEDGYTAEYTKWLEEKVLNIIRAKQDVEELNELLEYAEQEVQNANREIANLEQENARLEDQVDYYSTKDGGGQ